MGTRTVVAEVENGPILKQRPNRVWHLYFKGKNKRGKMDALRVPLHVYNEAAAKEKFAAWLKKNKLPPSNPPMFPHTASKALTVVKDQPGETPEKAEARRAKQRGYYYNAKAKKNGNGHAVEAKAGRLSIDGDVAEAVMQSLSSTLQSMAASVKLLNALLERTKH